MRKSLVLTACMLCLFIVAGVLVLRAPFAAFGIGAAVDIYPETLNLKSSGAWVTVYIELPEGYNVSDIDVTTVFLDGTIPADSELWKIGDYDEDGVSDMMVKFDRQAVIDYIWAKLYHMGSQISDKKWEVPLTITGELFNDPMISFAGSDMITVIYVG